LRVNAGVLAFENLTPPTEMLMRTFLLLLALLLAGCQSYEPLPLEPEQHQRDWRTRAVTDQAVADYAAELAARSETARPAFNPADGLTLPEAEVVALFFNPHLRVARLEAGVELATAEEAGRWQDPELELEGGWIFGNLDQPWFAAVGIKFTIPLSGRPGVEQDLAFSRHRASLRRVVAQEWETLGALRAHWRELESVRERRRLTESYLAELDALQTRAAPLQEAGEISSLDLRLVEIERAARRAELTALRHEGERAESTIRELLGLHPDAPLELVTTTPQAPELPAQLEATLQRNHTGLALRRAEYETAEQELRLEVRKQFPDLSIGPGYELEEGQSRISIGLGIPIPIINLNKEGIARAKAARLASKAVFEAELESAVHQLSQARRQLRNSQELRQQIVETVVPLADRQVADAAALAQAGEFDALRQLEVLSRRHETRIQVFEATLGQVRAQDTVLVLLGPAFKPDEEKKE
jgi:outer membrane protein TolC